jgi:enterochelin esterase-like enzyme
MQGRRDPGPEPGPVAAPPVGPDVGPEALVALAREARGPVVRATTDPGRFAVTFVHADREARRVGLLCPAVPGGYAALAPLGAGVFAVSVELPRGTRVKYHFAPDPPEHLDEASVFALAHSPTARRIDRFNPTVDQVHLHGLRLRIVESLLTLPGAVPAPPDRPDPRVPAGTVVPLSMRSRALGRRKDVLVHRPAGYPSAAGLPVVLLLQANEEWGRPALLDHLAATEGMPAFVTVVTTDRGFTARLRDLSGCAEHARFVVDELWPALQQECGVSAEEAVVAGYSAGGPAAAALALDEPQRFPRVALVSGALHLPPDMDLLRAGNHSSRLHDRYATAAVLPRRVYLAAGDYEDIAEPAILRATTALARILAERGTPVRLDTGPTGHDTVSARAYLAAGLPWLLRAG